MCWRISLKNTFALVIWNSPTFLAFLSLLLSPLCLFTHLLIPALPQSAPTTPSSPSSSSGVTWGTAALQYRSPSSPHLSPDHTLTCLPTRYFPWMSMTMAAALPSNLALTQTQIWACHSLLKTLLWLSHALALELICSLLPNVAQLGVTFWTFLHNEGPTYISLKL